MHLFGSRGPTCLRRVAAAVVTIASVSLAAAGADTASATATGTGSVVFAQRPESAGFAPQPAAVGAAALTWSDEFDGPAGSAPDPSRWRYDIGGGGWGNQELEYYTNSTRNAAHDGAGQPGHHRPPGEPGRVRLLVRPLPVHLGPPADRRPRSRQAYGRFEARIKIPRGQGMWPAFWMLGNNIGTVGWPNSGEIDIMENIGREPATVHGTPARPGLLRRRAASAGAYTLPGGQAFADAFHTFAVDWAPDSITWYVDGIQYSTEDPGRPRRQPVGLRPPVLHDHERGRRRHSGPARPDGSTSFPQTMVVDYVRVYAYAAGGGRRPADRPITGYGGKCVDVAGANTANGTPVQLWDCNGTAAQRWTIGADGTIRALGKCMDVSGGSTANGARVQLWDCNGTGAQRWQAQRRPGPA